MISRVLDRESRVGNIRSIDKRFRACVKRADEQGITMFGMDDRRCWTSDVTEQSYDKFGSSKDCKEKRGKASGLSDSLSVFVYRKIDQGKMFYAILFNSKDDRQSKKKRPLQFYQIHIMNTFFGILWNVLISCAFTS